MYIPTTLKIFLKSSKVNSDGLSPVLLRFTQNRKVNTLSLKKWVRAKDWVNSNGCFIKETGKDAPHNAKVTNRFLRSFLTQAENILLEAQMNNSAISFAEFKGKIINSNRQDFLVFFKEEIDRREKSGFASSTIKTYRSEHTKLKNYKSNISFADLTPNFLKAYRNHLINDLENGQNTVFRAMKTLKTFLNEARSQKVTEIYPFDEFKFTYQKGTRAQLTLSELEQLDKLYYRKELPSRLQNILHYFLFACYTGLSFSDLEVFQYESIYENSGEFFIRGKRKKTNSDFIVPLMNKAKQLINLEKKSGIVFPWILSNQKSNKGLKEIAELIHISKHLTFHVARHTFGTVALNQGIPQEVVQKMMGHSTSEMTANYAKVLDSYILKEMKKWDEQSPQQDSISQLPTLSKEEQAYFKSLRVKIIAARIASNLSEEEVAQELGISLQSYQSIERGIVDIGVMKIKKLEGVLGGLIL